MKELLVTYKPVIRFVVLFLGTYILLSGLYGFYLQQSTSEKYYPDFITYIVSEQSNLLLNATGNVSEIAPHEEKPMIKMYINNQYIFNIIEGCNSVSIIILFIAFVVAFAQKFKKTAVFILAGSTLIYGANLIRIVILAIALQRYPEQETLLHDIVFPGIIYGMVFLLWVVWVRSITKATIDE